MRRKPKPELPPRNSPTIAPICAKTIPTSAPARINGSDDGISSRRSTCSSIHVEAEHHISMSFFYRKDAE